MADELRGEAAALAQISDIVGAPENTNVAAVVRKRGESDEQIGLRKAGYGRLQRALLLSPLAVSADRASRLGQRDIALEMRDRDLVMRQNALDLREQQAINRAEMDGIRTQKLELEVLGEKQRIEDARREMSSVAEFINKSSQLDPRSPNFLSELNKIAPVTSSETDTGKMAASRYNYLLKLHSQEGSKLLPDLLRAQREGYTGIVKDEDGSIDPWASQAGLAEWAQSREQANLSREDNRIQSGREFQGISADIQALRKQRADLEKVLLDTDSDEQEPIQSQLDAIEEQIGEAIKVRKQATNPNPASAPTKAAPVSNSVEAAQEALRKIREQKK